MNTIGWAIKGTPTSVVLSNDEEIVLDPEQAERVALVLSESPTLTPEQAAHFLGVSRPMVVRWVRDGRLADGPVGTHHRIPIESVLELHKARVCAGEFAVALVAQATSDPELEALLSEAREAASAMIARRDSAQ